MCCFSNDVLDSVDSVTLLKLAYSHIFPLITHAPMDCDKALPDLHHQIRALHKNKSGFGDGKTSTRRIKRKSFFKKRYEIVSSCKINMVEKNILALIFDWKITATKRRLQTAFSYCSIFYWEQRKPNRSISLSRKTRQSEIGNIVTDRKLNCPPPLCEESSAVTVSLLWRLFC